MSFTNSQVDIGQLPAAEAIDWQLMDPRYPRLVVFQVLAIMAPIYLLPSLVLLIAIKGWGPALLVSALVAGIGTAVTTVVVAIARAMAKAHRIALREHDFALRKGLIWQRSIFVLLSRVQHVEISQGIIERRMKMATLKLFTAGGAQADLKIPGLDRADAMSLRRKVLKASDLVDLGEADAG